MQNITVYTGQQGKGKTVRAKEIANGKKYAWFNGLEHYLVNIKDVKPETELVIIDEVHTQEHLQILAELISKNPVLYREPYTRLPIQFNHPDAIICTQVSIPDSIKEMVSVEQF